jgi:hypothetical protein
MGLGGESVGIGLPKMGQYGQLCPLGTIRYNRHTISFPRNNKEHIMAKKQVNKAQAVRDYLKAHPGTGNKELAEALTKQGVKISANHVANIKSKMAVSKGKRTRRGKAARAMSTKSGISVHEIKTAFGLLKECGGIEGAKAALAAAVEIQKIM